MDKYQREQVGRKKGIDLRNYKSYDEDNPGMKDFSGTNPSDYRRIVCYELQLFNNQLTLTNTTLAKYYGLPKVYEKDVPFCSVISLVNSPSYLLSKLLNNGIQNILSFRNYV